MWCWLLLRRSVSLHWCISLVGFDYFLSFSRYFHVVLLRSLCIFLRVRSIFRGLLLCWSMYCWFGCCFEKSFLSHLPQVWGIRWCHLPIFLLVSQSLCWSCILSWVQSSILQLSTTISHSVMLLFSAPISISFFVSLVPASNLRIFIFSMASFVLLSMHSI